MRGVRGGDGVISATRAAHPPHSLCDTFQIHDDHVRTECRRGRKNGAMSLVEPSPHEVVGLAQEMSGDLLLAGRRGRMRCSGAVLEGCRRAGC